MRLYGPSSTRQFSEDRNPLIINLCTTTFPIGNGVQGVVSYICPANRRLKFFVHIVGVVTIALAAGQHGEVFYQNAGGFAGMRLWFPLASPLNTRENATSGFIYATAGGQHQIFTNLDAGAGQMHAGGMISGVEYDP